MKEAKKIISSFSATMHKYHNWGFDPEVPKNLLLKFSTLKKIKAGEITEWVVWPQDYSEVENLSTKSKSLRYQSDRRNQIGEFTNENGYAWSGGVVWVLSERLLKHLLDYEREFMEELEDDY